MRSYYEPVWVSREHILQILVVDDDDDDDDDDDISAMEIIFTEAFEGFQFWSFEEAVCFTVSDFPLRGLASF